MGEIWNSFMFSYKSLSAQNKPNLECIFTSRAAAWSKDGSRSSPLSFPGNLVLPYFQFPNHLNHFNKPNQPVSKQVSKQVFKNQFKNQLKTSFKKILFTRLVFVKRSFTCRFVLWHVHLLQVRSPHIYRRLLPLRNFWREPSFDIQETPTKQNR